jgi:four helix bundle protein
MQKSLIRDKSYQFALEIIRIYQEMIAMNEYVLSRQLVKAGTSIGANVEEALAGQSRADFLSKMSIGSKEARETRYWLRLLRDSGFLRAPAVEPLICECDEIVKMLTSIVKTTSSSITGNGKVKVSSRKARL